MATTSIPTVSIGVPVYNGENYIEECLLSLLQQTWEGQEIVISDNASSDGTEEICRFYANLDPRVRYFRAPVNRGAAWNFNCIFELSREPLFRWAGHEDLCALTHVQRCLEVLQDDSKVVLCSTQVGISDDLRREIVGTQDARESGVLAMQGPTAQGEQKRIQRSAADEPVTWFRGIPIDSLRCYEVYGLLRRECMQKSIGHPNYCSGDKVWLSQMALMGRFHELPEKLFFSRWHDARFSCNSSLEHQNEHMDPAAKNARRIPHQFRSTIGYAHVIGTVPLSHLQRLKCWTVWLNYCLQWQKLGRIASLTFSGDADSVSIPPNAIHRRCPVQLPDRKFWPTRVPAADAVRCEPTRQGE